MVVLYLLAMILLSSRKGEHYEKRQYDYEFMDAFSFTYDVINLL